MAEVLYCPLPPRGVLVIAGDDRRSFLQGLISNDVRKVGTERAIHAALLTPQGKFLHDFFVGERDETLQLEGEAGRLDDLRRRLTLFKLRAKVTLTLAPELRVAAVWGAGAAASFGLAEERGSARIWGGGIAFVDPRLAEAGVRVIAPPDDIARLNSASLTETSADAYDRHRLALGLPDGSRDLVVEKSILLENGFDELAGVDWEKGCYMGQELTARTKYRGLIKKRLMPVAIAGPAPEPGTPLLLGDKEAGEMRSSCGDLGLALVRLEALAEAGDQPLIAGTARLTPRKPAWANY